MSLALTANTLALAPGRKTYFAVSGGVPPYTFSVLPGGVGGSVDGDGVYTAPSLTLGRDVVQVVDSTLITPLVATANVLVGNALLLFCDVLQTELGLADGRVFLWDQKEFQPEDDRMFIAVSVLNAKPYSNNRKYDGSGSGLDSENYANFLATLSVDIISRGPEARDRKEEIILALNSNYAQSQQEVNSFYIGKLSSNFVNISTVDGAAIPYRFNISVNIQYCATKAKAVEYFTQFTDDITTDP